MSAAGVNASTSPTFGPTASPALHRVGAPVTWSQAINPGLMLAQIARDRSLIWQFAQRDVSARHRGSWLGVLWVLLHPLVMLAVYTFVFAIIWEARWSGTPASAASPGPLTGTLAEKATFALTLFCGLVVYEVFSASVTGAPSLIVNHPNYVKKVIFPLEVLPLAQVLAALVLSSVGIGVLLFANLALRHAFSPTLWAFPLVLLPLVLLAAGLTLLLSALGVFLRDLKVIVTVLVQILFFITPILYPAEKLEKLPEWLGSVLSFNPLAPIFEGARRTLVFGQLPDAAGLAYATLVGAVCFLAGYAVFTKAKRGFADVL
jgi:lipopolysaccharide transport system permease protein